MYFELFPVAFRMTRCFFFICFAGKRMEHYVCLLLPWGHLLVIRPPPPPPPKKKITSHMGVYLRCLRCILPLPSSIVGSRTGACCVTFTTRRTFTRRRPTAASWRVTTRRWVQYTSQSHREVNILGCQRYTLIYSTKLRPSVLCYKSMCRALWGLLNDIKKKTLLGDVKYCLQLLI